MADRFSWNDGVQTAYTTHITPRVEDLTEERGQLVPLLSGGTFYAVQTNSDGTVALPTKIRISWDWVPPEFLPIVHATFANVRQVTCVYPWRGSTATITGRVVQYPKETPIEGDRTSLEIIVAEVGV